MDDVLRDYIQILVEDLKRPKARKADDDEYLK
jgi:hypothetical protein